MGLTSALNTALNGLGMNETTIDVIGNNIANAGTNGFKSSQVLFETQLARTLSVGSSPDDSSGNAGTNPRQIGLGAATASIQRDFGQGGIATTASPSDLAIEGDGFFILDGPEGDRYTRDGTFQLNSTNLLVNNAGLRVQGYAVDDDFQLTSELRDIIVPIGDLRVAEATRNVGIGGALRTSEGAVVGNQGTILLSDALVDTSGGATAITSATSLTSVFNNTTQLFNTGDEIAFSPRKGDRTLDLSKYTVTGTDTVQDFLDFVKNSLGIINNGDPNVEGTIPNDGSGDLPGIDVVGGQIRIVGNMGSQNDIEFLGSTFTRNGLPVEDLNFDKTQAANGESTLLSLNVFDSLGDAVDMSISAVLESRTASTATYRYFVESVKDGRPQLTIDSGLITFDSNGKVTGDVTKNVTIDRSNTNADTIDLQLDFSSISGFVAASEPSGLDVSSKDGSAPGVLTTFNINEAGVINGIFDNGAIRTLGQIALARFRNPQGLVESGGTTFREGVSSGERLLRTPGNGGAGTVRSGAVELSNTDVGRSLVDLIVSSTNYRGNARVISSVQSLVDELLVLGR